MLRQILHEIDDKITPGDLDLMIEEIDADGSGTVDFEGIFLKWHEWNKFLSFLFFCIEFMEVMTGKVYQIYEMLIILCFNCFNCDTDTRLLSRYKFLISTRDFVKLYVSAICEKYKVHITKRLMSFLKFLALC